MTPQEATRLAAEIVALSNRVAPSRTAAVTCANCGKSHAGAVTDATQPQPSGLFAGLLSNTSGTVPPPPSMEDAIRAARGLTPVAQPQAQAQTSGVPAPPDLATAIRAAQEARR